MTYINEASVIATSVIFLVLGIVAVSLRFLVRGDRKVALGADDSQELSSKLGKI